MRFGVDEDLAVDELLTVPSEGMTSIVRKLVNGTSLACHLESCDCEIEGHLVMGRRRHLAIFKIEMDRRMAKELAVTP